MLFLFALDPVKSELAQNLCFVSILTIFVFGALDFRRIP